MAASTAALIMMSTKSTFCLLLAGVTLCVGGLLTADASYGPGFESYKIPKATWLKEEDMLPAGGRRMLATPKCTIQITGTGKQFGVKAASIKCTSAVTFFAGAPLVNYQKAHPSSFSNVKLQLPNEPNFLGTGNAEPCLFLVQVGPISLTGYVRNLWLVDWAAILVEAGTQATISGFEFTKNHGVRFPTVAIDGPGSAAISNSTWTSNVCTSVTRCHTPGVYATGGARISLTKSTFTSNKGHLAGALMITSGALGTVTSNTFTGNSCVNNGDFGGAVFHDLCTDPGAAGKQSTFRSNKFIDNKTLGFGGAMCIGSIQGGCKPTIADNTFTGNHAKYTGGAIYFRYCGSKVPYLSKNVFNSNTATTFNGQIGYNPKTKPAKQGGGSSGSAGCAKPTNYKNKFTGSVPTYSPAWFFP